MPTVQDITQALEAYAPLNLQEHWDNSGLQIGHADMEVSGVLASVDVTVTAVEEAIDKGLNMIVSHHPLLFKGLKNITSSNMTQKAVEMAIMNRIAVYSCHTSLDNAQNGVSAQMAKKLGAKILRPLVPDGPESMTGSGVVCELDTDMTPKQLIELIRNRFEINVLRCSSAEKCPASLKRVALCGGAGGGFINDAIAAGATAYLTADLRYHDFIDYADKILLIDAGHFETELLTKHLFKEILSDKFPQLEVIISESEKNPVKYIYN